MSAFNAILDSQSPFGVSADLQEVTTVTDKVVIHHYELRLFPQIVTVQYPLPGTMQFTPGARLSVSLWQVPRLAVLKRGEVGELWQQAIANQNWRTVIVARTPRGYGCQVQYLQSQKETNFSVRTRASIKYFIDLLP